MSAPCSAKPRHRRASAWLHDYAWRARVIEAEHGRVPLELLFDIGGAAEMEANAGLHEKLGTTQHDRPPFDTFTFESEEPVPVQRLHNLLGNLPRSIFRVKGIVNLVEKPEHPCVLQATGRRAALTVGDVWGDRSPSTQIVFIGSRGGVDGELIRRELER